jgi:hypothetical protein
LFFVLVEVEVEVVTVVVVDRLKKENVEEN